MERVGVLSHSYRITVVRPTSLSRLKKKNHLHVLLTVLIFYYGGISNWINLDV